MKKEIENEKEKETFKLDFESNEEKILFLGEYMNDIYSNLLEDEKNLKIKPRHGYMEQQQDINHTMRRILINWIIEIHNYFRLKEETLYQTIWIIDTYLTSTQISRLKLQLVGIAALLISSKEYEIYYPNIWKFLQIADNAFTKDELFKMENDILLKLKFNIICPTPIDFYNILAKAHNFDMNKYLFGKYFIESCLLDYDLIKYSASLIGVACTYVVMKFFGINDYKKLYSKKILNENKPAKVIKDAARDICYAVKKVHNSNLHSVRDKYSSPIYLNVAQYCD
jgi:cyclin B